MANLGQTDLDVHPLCLGGNVFGWTADRDASFAVLDAYFAAGGNFVDTAESYASWVEGNSGGESERIIGEWMASRGNRADVIVATKTRDELTPANLRVRAEASLRHLRSDYIDVYYIHNDDLQTPLEETLSGYDALVRDGLVRHVAVSNISAPRLREALAIIEREGFSPFVALQPHYNLLERTKFETELRPVVEQAGLSTLPYWALASGFLTGKYRPGGDVDSQRAAPAGAYLQDPRAVAVLDVVDEVAAAHESTVAAVALAWLAAQPTVAAPIASARTVEQLASLLPFADLRLSDAEIGRLSAASASSQ